MEVDTAEPLPSGHSVDSPDAQRQMEINIGKGVSVRAAYRAVRKHLRVEARRQKELEEGRPPEVLLESFLELLKHKLRRVPEPPKRVLTPAAKAATLCWCIANGKECLNGDRCTFKHVVPQVKEQTASRTGVSQPGPATERDGSLRPSATPELQRSAASVLCSSEESELNKGSATDDCIKCWDECFCGDSSADTRGNNSQCDSGVDAQHKYHTGNDWRSRHWKMDSWRVSHWETRGWHQKDDTWSKNNVGDGWNSSHWETSGWCQEDECRHDHDKTQWFSHAFFEALNVDQLINSLHRGEESVTPLTGLEVDPGESLADTAAQSGIIDLRPFGKAEDALFHKFGLKPRVIHSNSQAVGTGGQAKVLGKVGVPS